MAETTQPGTGAQAAQSAQEIVLKVETVTDGEKTKTVYKTPDGKLFVPQETADAAIRARHAELRTQFEEKLNAASAENAALKRAGVDVEASNKALQDSYNALLETIPSDKRALVPPFGSMVERLTYIKDHRGIFQAVVPSEQPVVPPVQPNNTGEPPPPPAITTPSDMPDPIKHPVEHQAWMIKKGLI